MIVITVARKPVSEGTVAGNVIRHGCGAINVDGTRIGRGGGTRRDGKANRPTAAGWENMRGHGIAVLDSGRWPANVIFEHKVGCTLTGSEVVSGAGGHIRHNRARDSSVAEGADKPHRVPGYGEGRTETVAAWDCAEGCPVADLDSQGERRSSGIFKAVDHGPNGREHSTSFGNRGVPNAMYADSGGASRFFKCIGGS